MYEDKPLILGHRGAMGSAPENTIISFKKALEQGADGVEFDVQMTKDGELVVIHDENIERISGKKAMVKDLTLQEIKKYDAGSHYKKRFSGAKIPTLAETLEVVKKCSVINIEIKNGPIIYPEIEEKVVQTVREFDISDKVIISSFNHNTIRKIKEISPDLHCGLLHMAGLYHPWEYAKLVGVDALHPYGLSISPETIRECHQREIKINVFGVNDKNALKRLIEYGVDIIITDYPRLALDLLEKNKD